MQRMILAVVCAATWAAWTPATWAQVVIYRCGNEYTNNAALAKQRNCPVMEGGHVTVVHSPAPAASTGTTASGTSAAGNPPRSVRVDPTQQKARDSDAKAILQAELAKAQERLHALKQEFNDGNPTKSALELRNPQAFNERLEQLKASIARQESDVAGIQRELERHSGG